jgi:hypothetical protein
MAGVKLGEKTARALVALLNQGGYQQEGLTSSAKADTGPITFRNDSGENVPRYGCMKVTDAILDGSRYVVLIDKPDGTGGPFLFNGPREVEPEQRGTCQHGPVVRAAFSTGTVTAGEVWGPESDWVVTSAGDPALTVYGDVEDDVLLGTIIIDESSRCDDLAPGVYKGTAGAAFTPGESGPILVDEVTYTGTNQSNCNFRLGDLIFVGVEKDCDIFFTGCKCCTEEEDACCNRKIAICICGQQKIVAVDGGVAVFDVSDCCCCDEATLTITLACEDDTITGTWEYDCGELTDSGNLNSFNLTSLCSDDDVSVTGDLVVDGCDEDIPVRASNYVMSCVAVPCETEPCVQCVEYTSYTADKSEVPGTIPDIGVNDGDVSINRSVTCTGQTVTVTFEVTNNTGGLWEPCPMPDPDCYLYFNWESHGLSLVSTSPPHDRTDVVIYDLGVSWDITLANGASAVYSVTLEQDAGCTEDTLFEIAVVRGFRGEGGFDCVACP